MVVTDGKGMAKAMANGMANPMRPHVGYLMQRYGTVRNGTVRHQDPDTNSSVLNAAGAVDNEDPRLKRFIELDDSGWSARQIATALHVTPRTVQRWRAATGRSHGEPVTPKPAALRNRAAELLDEGASFAETAETVGVTWSTIARWFPNRHGWSKSEASSFAVTRRRLEATIYTKRAA